MELRHISDTYLCVLVSFCVHAHKQAVICSEHFETHNDLSVSVSSEEKIQKGKKKCENKKYNCYNLQLIAYFLLCAIFQPHAAWQQTRLISVLEGFVVAGDILVISLDISMHLCLSLCLSFISALLTPFRIWITSYSSQKKKKKRVILMMIF